MPDAPPQPLDNRREHSHASENENLKPGEPPGPSTEPKGSEGSAKTSKTHTDPSTGAPTGGRPDTAGG